MSSAVEFTTAADNITFATGNIDLGAGANLDIDTGAAGGNITIGAEIAGTSVETVTLDAGTGTTSVGVIGSGTEIGVLSIGSAENGGITLNGAIVTDGAVLIDGPVTLATGAVSVTTADDAITFNHSIDGGQALTLVSGTAATAIQGAIGATTSLGSLSSTATGNTTFGGNFTGKSLTNSGPAIVSGNAEFNATNTINFGSTLNSSDGTQTITLFSGSGSDITITGVVGGSNAFSNFTVYSSKTNNNTNNFTYSGGGSISNLTELNIFSPGSSIDTIVNPQDKEIAFFDSPVFKLFNSLVTPTITDLLDTGITGSDGTDIQVDFLDGDTLIIDKSLELASNEFDSLETNFAGLFDDSLLDDSSDVSINSTGIELFKTSSLNSINEKSNLDELLISFTKNDDLYQGKSFIF